jgi:enediyne biosynthesis protein E4
VARGWADFNNDGFLDLFVANVGGQNNFLYQNDGNKKSRISIKGIGTTSNRSAIGTKIKVKATIGGSTRWQTRQISSANGWDGSDLRAYFGLGDASIIETLRIEWPSGVIQESRTSPSIEF